MSDKSLRESRWRPLSTTTCCLLLIIATLSAGLTFRQSHTWRQHQQPKPSEDNHDNWLLFAAPTEPHQLDEEEEVEGGFPAEPEVPRPATSKSFNATLPSREDSNWQLAHLAKLTDKDPKRARRSLTERMRFVLMCQILDGDAPVQIKWFKDNQELSEPAKFDEQLVELAGQDELGASLLFRHVQPQHSGNYTCIATNHFGSSSYSSIMSVKVPPRWKVEPQDQESIMGEQITIDCQAAGWKFSSVAPTPLSGEFANQQLQHPVASQLLMAPMAQQQKQHAAFGQQQQQQATFEQQQQMSASNNNMRSPLPVGANFKLINSNHHVQSLENGSLSIRQANKEHEGFYMCEADNGIEPNLVKFIRLTVHLQAQFADEIQVSGFANVENAGNSSSNKLNLIGTGAPLSGSQLIKTIRLAQNTSQLKLLCQPFGDLPLTFDWLKDGQLIYTHSTGQSAEQLSVSGPSAFDLTGGPAAAPTSLNRASDLSNRFHVNTRRSSQRPLMGLESELVIINLRRLDAGLYTCLARNSYGSSERKLRLIVQEAPEPPEVVDVAHIGSRSISLRWISPAYDGNSPISKYVVEFWRNSPVGGQNLPDSQPSLAHNRESERTSALGLSEKIMPLKGTGPNPIEPSQQQQQEQQQQQLVVLGQQQQIQHTVHDLEPLTRYSVRVVAVNSIGRSRPSVALSLRTEEEVPSVVASPVEAIVLSSKSIKLHWTITYAAEHEIIDGFFVGYRSFDPQLAGPSSPQTSRGRAETTGDQQPTFTYKTIRLTNNRPSQLDLQHHQQQQPHPVDASSAFLSPVSSLTKNVPLSQIVGQTYPIAHNQQQTQTLVVSKFEYIINGLERNTEYSILIQCFNKKGAGPASDSVVFKTLANDPPEKLTLNAEEITESSLKVKWSFINIHEQKPGNHIISKPTGGIPEDSIDGFVLTFAKLTSQLKFKQWNETLASTRANQPAAHISNLSPQLSPSVNSVEQWQAVQLAPQQRSHQLKNLECGTSYALKIWAFNKIGKGEPSDLLTVSTRGKAPVAPDKRAFVSANSTQVRLHLNAWYDGGCEIDKFIVHYRVRGQQEWILVSNNIFKEQMSVVIRDLAPGTSYELLVAAQNQVGPTEVKYRFTTLDAEGKQVLYSHHRSFLNRFTSFASDTGTQGDDDNDYYLDSEGAEIKRSQLWSDSPGYFRPVLFLRQLLTGSSAGLLFLTSLCLICLLMFVVYRRFLNNLTNESLNQTASNKSCSSSGGRPNGPSGGSGSADLMRVFGPNPVGVDRLSVEVNGTGLDSCDAPPLSLANESFTESPRVVNSIPYQQQTDCGHYKTTFCPQAAPGAGDGANMVDYGRSPNLQDCSNYMSAVYGPHNNYSLLTGNNQPTSYATVQRGEALETGSSLNENEQRCLMQMLMLTQPSQNQNQNQVQTGCGNQSYVGALATMSRVKNGLDMKSGCPGIAQPFSGFTNGNVTLGRQHFDSFQNGFQRQRHQEANNCNSQGQTKRFKINNNSGPVEEDESRFLITVNDETDAYQMNILNPQRDTYVPSVATSSTSCSNSKETSGHNTSYTVSSELTEDSLPAANDTCRLLADLEGAIQLIDREAHDQISSCDNKQPASSQYDVPFKNSKYQTGSSKVVDSLTTTSSTNLQESKVCY